MRFIVTRWLRIEVAVKERKYSEHILQVLKHSCAADVSSPPFKSWTNFNSEKINWIFMARLRGCVNNSEGDLTHQNNGKINLLIEANCNRSQPKGETKNIFWWFLKIKKLWSRWNDHAKVLQSDGQESLCRCNCSQMDKNYSFSMG